MEMFNFASVMQTSYESDFIHWPMRDDEICHFSFVLKRKNTWYASNVLHYKVDPKGYGVK